MNQVQVLLSDPYKLFREGIRQILSGSPFTIIAEFGNVRDTLSYFNEGGSADLILLEPAAPQESPVAILQMVRAAAPQAKLVALTVGGPGLYPLDALRAGADGLLYKDISPQSFIHSLQLVVLGERILPIHSGFFAPEGTLGTAKAAAEPTDEPDLSDREINVLRCLASGLPNKLIARELNVAEATVKAHVKTIMRKINADNRTQVAVWCVERRAEPRPGGDFTIARPDERDMG